MNIIKNLFIYIYIYINENLSDCMWLPILYSQIPWLWMTYRRTEPGHQQLSYGHTLAGTINASCQKLLRRYSSLDNYNIMGRHRRIVFLFLENINIFFKPFIPTEIAPVESTSVISVWMNIIKNLFIYIYIYIHKWKFIWLYVATYLIQSNTMAVDDLSANWTRASAAIIWTYVSWNYQCLMSKVITTLFITGWL